MTFRDHFSGAANSYARFRPTYPPSLFAWLAGAGARLDRVWDCGTGNGQAAVGIATHASLVLASDASVAQVASASPHPRVRYLVCRAECSPLASRSVALVMVAQALHWFDAPAFFEEVRRVLRPGGLIAVWSYGVVRLDRTDLDEAMQRFEARLAPHWPPERAHVDAGYRTLAFPFHELEAPPLALEHEWTLDELIGYVGTWSAVLKYRESSGVDPTPVLRDALTSTWGPPDRRRVVRWPLVLRVGVL